MGIIKDHVRVLAEEFHGGGRGQICLGKGFIMRELHDRGYRHAKLERIAASNSLLSIRPRKSAASGTVPIDFKVHGGAFIELPERPGSWLGGRWGNHFVGLGWVYVDVRRGEVDKGYTMRLLLPSREQRQRALDTLRQAPHYPEFD